MKRYNCNENITFCQSSDYKPLLWGMIILPFRFEDDRCIRRMKSVGTFMGIWFQIGILGVPIMRQFHKSRTIRCLRQSHHTDITHFHPEWSEQRHLTPIIYNFILRSYFHGAPSSRQVDSRRFDLWSNCKRVRGG